MATERAKIIRLMRELSAEDAARARQAHRSLVQMGPRALAALSAGLKKLAPEAHPALIQVLAEIGGPGALVRLMRFVFDGRDGAGEGQTRALAMQAIIDLAGPADDPRLLEFLCDMRHDTDELVRTYIVECFATLGDARALDYLREALSDPSEYVRARARLAFSEVQRTQQIHPLELEGRDFLHELTRAGPQRHELFARWLPEHRNAFELASALVRADGPHTQLGIETLHALQNPAARNVALRHFKLTRSDADRAASLSLMAAFLRADARPEEVRTIEQGLAHGDGFVHLAALDAAGRSGDETLLCRTLSATRANNAIIAATAATALRAIAEHLPGWMRAEVLKSVQLLRRRRAYEPNANLLQAEAALLHTLGEFYAPGDEGVGLAQAVVLDSLRDSQQFEAIAQASLVALERLTPATGLPARRRWHPGDACALVALLNHPDPATQRAALELIRRAAPGDTPNLCHEFERLLYTDAPALSPLLIRAIIDTNATAALLSLTRWMASQDPDTLGHLRQTLPPQHAAHLPANPNYTLEADPSTSELKR